MNCAPITINGGSSDDSFYNSLPNLFVANVAGGPYCMMVNDELSAYNLPTENAGTAGVMIQKPGYARVGHCPSVAALPVWATNGLDYLKSALPATGSVAGPAVPGAAANPTGGAAPAGGSNAAPASAAASSTPSGAANSPSSAAQSSTTPAPAAAAPPPADSAGVFHTEGSDGGDGSHPSVASFTTDGAASSTPQSSTSAAARSSMSSPAADSPVPPPAASSAAAPTPAPTLLTSTLTVAPPAISTAAGASAPAPAVSSEAACPSPGDIYCYDEQHFGICGSDNKATVAQSVAAGMACINNAYVYASAPNGAAGASGGASGGASDGAGPTAAVVRKMKRGKRIIDMF
jgi:hypothetical protein